MHIRRNLRRLLNYMRNSKDSIELLYADGILFRVCTLREEDAQIKE